MITIPVAVANEWFRKQIDFFQFQHFEVYGEDAINKAIIPIVNRNRRTEEIQKDVDWNIKLPYKMVDSILDIYNLDKDWFIPTNVFVAAKQVIEDLPDDELIEVIDSDLVHLKKYDGIEPNYDEVVADAYYENWHLKTSTRESQNYHVIRKYINHNDFKYMNGGFNIISRVKTFKKIMDDVINISIKIGYDQKGNNHSWWQTMYGLNVACHNHKIKMIDGRNCYYPSANQLQDRHHIAHYCCDKIMDKRNMNNLKPDEFPNNKFYNQAKKWLKSV